MSHFGNEKPIGCFVLSVSDTRTLNQDESGNLIIQSLEKVGHRILGRNLVADEKKHIEEAIQHILAEKKLECIIVTGGTGITPRDITCEAVTPFLNKTLDGFGELFRYLSFKEMGANAILSRALAGTTKEGVLLFVLPGSKKAVTLAMNELILPVLPHAVSLARK